jgi:outer membrane receptor protein involved in Fe transport
VRSSAYPEQLGRPWKATTDGLYAQAVYGFAPKWNVGLRYDILGITNTLDSPTKEDFGSSDRWTVDVTWDLSEFSRLRAQYATSNVLVLPGERERFGAFYLQFLMSLGAHGAHGF